MDRTDKNELIEIEVDSFMNLLICKPCAGTGESSTINPEDDCFDCGGCGWADGRVLTPGRLRDKICNLLEKYVTDDSRN